MKRTPVEMPTALPKLTRFLPVELKAVRKGKSKEKEVRDAIVKFDETVEPDQKKKARAWRRLVKLAKRLNITIEQAKNAELAAWRAAAEAEPDPDDPDEDDEEDDQDERDGDAFEMSFSSETPVPRWFGDEILDHSPDAVDLSRAGNGLSYLVDHDTGDQVGIIDNFRVENKKTVGTVRFSRSQRAQDIKRDVQDRIRAFTSIGYRVMDMVLERETDDENGQNSVYRVTKWQPMEASTVAVPADYTVGPGRSAGQQEFPVQVRSAAGKPLPIIPTEVRTMNPKDAAEIIRLCTTHGIDSKRAAEMIEKEGMSVDLASREILAEVAKRGGKALATPAAETTAQLELTEREQKQYNLCRGIMTQVRSIENNKNETSFETEISDEIAKRHEGKKHGGLFVPWRLRVDPAQVREALLKLSTRGTTTLAADSSTKGQELVFTEPGPFIQFLYNRMRLKELGAETISGLQGNIAFPKQTGRATGSWVAENPGADVADSNLTLAQVTMSPKTYQSSASYSRQLLAQAVIDIDNLVRMDLARDCALAIDLAGIAGTGSSDDPTGILHTTGVQSYTVEGDSGNGAKPDWNDITLMEEMLEDVNADQVGDFSWLTTPGIKGLFKRTPRLLYAPAGGTTVNVTGDPIWTDDDTIDGNEARSSNQVPNDFVVGTSDGSMGHPKCHALIAGVFNSMINGLWGSGFELVVDPYRLKKQGLIELTTFILTDWALRYPVAFVAATDCLKQ